VGEATPGIVFYEVGPRDGLQNEPDTVPTDARREAEELRLREAYRDGVDIERLASELLVDAIVPPAALRGEITARLRVSRGRRDPAPPKRRGVTPV